MRIRLVFFCTIVTLTSANASQAADSDPWFGKDKIFHFTASALIAGGGYGITAAFTEDRTVRLLVGAGAAAVAGGGKELLDLTGAGDPSWKDLAWDGIGAVFGLATAYALDRWVLGANSPATSFTPVIGHGAGFSFRF